MTTEEIDVLLRTVKRAGDQGKPHGIGPVTLLQILTQFRAEHTALLGIRMTLHDHADTLAGLVAETTDGN